MNDLETRILAAPTEREFRRLAKQYGGLERAQELVRTSGMVTRLSPEPIHLVERPGAPNPKLARELRIREQRMDELAVDATQRTARVKARLREELRVRRETLARLAAEDRQRSATTPVRSRPKPLYRRAAPVMKGRSGPSWLLSGPTAPTLDPEDPDIRTVARHESGHAAAAHLLGWCVTEVRLNSGRSGYCAFDSPKHLDRSLRHQQRAIICLAGCAHTGWTYLDGGKQDRRNAYRELAQIGGGTHLSEAAEAEAKRMAATPKFRAIARRIEEALLLKGSLSMREVEPLLHEARRENTRTAS